MRLINNFIFLSLLFLLNQTSMAETVELASSSILNPSFLSVTPDTDNAAPIALTPAPAESFWTKAWGTPIPNTLYLGMFTMHLNPASNTSDNWHNDLIAGSYNGYFAGTLINSFGVRAYAAGVERYWLTQQVTANFTYSLGYRLGLISGYTKHFVPLAAYTPVLPFPQVVYDLSWKNAGLELSWCVVTVSAGFFYRF